MSNYQLYRNTTLGITLQESIDELVQNGSVPPTVALRILQQFDKSINAGLSSKVKSRINFKGNLSTYRFCDSVWTFVLKDVEFKENAELEVVNKVKIVACDGKGAVC